MENLSSLTALTNLRRLNLASNRISQLCCLSMLTCLEDCNLSRNFIESLGTTATAAHQAAHQANIDEQEGVQQHEILLPIGLRKLNLASNRCGCTCCQHISWLKQKPHLLWSTRGSVLHVELPISSFQVETQNSLRMQHVLSIDYHVQCRVMCLLCGGGPSTSHLHCTTYLIFSLVVFAASSLACVSGWLSCKIWHPCNS